MRDYREEFWKGLEELRKRQEETDRQIKEAYKQIKELSLEVKKTTRSVAELNGVWKSYSEKIIFDNIEDALRNAGFKDFILRKNIKSEKNGNHIEIDFLAVGDGYVVVVETKTSLKVKDVRRFVKKLKDKFLEFFPEFKSYRIYGAVVGINLQDGVEKFAFKNGLMVFRYKDKGEVEILNPEGFEPKDFGVV